VARSLRLRAAGSASGAAAGSAAGAVGGDPGAPGPAAGAGPGPGRGPADGVPDAGAAAVAAGEEPGPETGEGAAGGAARAEAPDADGEHRVDGGERARGDDGAARSARERVIVAALGGTAGAVVALLAAAVADPLAGVLDVSPPSLRLAAGVVAIAAGLVAVVRRPPPPEPALAGRWAALVPVALPAVANPALVLGALAAGLDRGMAVVVVGLAVGVAALTVLTGLSVRAVGMAGDRNPRGLPWGARLIGAVLAAAGGALVLEAVYAV
jgi:small neutral amino acid transporter SnatA (MarC family)